MSSKPKKTNDIKSRLAELGIAFSREIPQRASFIMPDGSFLGLWDNAKAIAGCQVYPSHTDFESFLIRNGIKPSARDNLLGDHGAIQLNDGTYLHNYECAYVHLSEKNLTNAQKESLLRWLDHLAFETYKKNITVCSKGSVRVYDLASKSQPDGFLPDEIIRLL